MHSKLSLLIFMNLQAVGVNKNINLTLYYVLFNSYRHARYKISYGSCKFKTKCRLKSTYFKRIFVCWLKI